MNLIQQFRKTLDILTSFATLLAASGVVWIAFGRPIATSGTNARPTTPPPAAATKVDGLEIGLTPVRKDVQVAQQPKVAIIEFSDFQCPYCGRYARDTYPRVLKELVNRGVAAYSFRHNPLESIHPFAFRASAAAECAGRQGKFWPMHDLLFFNQKDLTETAFATNAEKLSLDKHAFASCLEADAAERIKQDQAEAKRFGLNGTPAFLIGAIQPKDKVKVLRKLSGAQPYEAFEAAVKEVMKEI
jgi:protein-disulfide isomerase